MGLIAYTILFSWNQNSTSKDVLRPTDMRLDAKYRFYYLGIIKIVVLGLFPLLSLSYLNWRIFNVVRASAASFQERDKYEQQKKENELARVLIGIIILFVVCHTFRVVIEIDNIAGLSNPAAIVKVCHTLCLPEFTLWSTVVDPLSELMMVVNSASNMVIYVCLNANFRKLMFPCIERSQRKFSQFLSTQPTQSNLNMTSVEEIPMYDKNN